MPLYYYHKVVDYNFRPYPYHVTLNAGRYQFEAWGASGMNNIPCINQSANIPKNGRGGYTKGILSLKTKTEFHIYIGQRGTPSGTFNCEYAIGRYLPGGGVTDFRLVNADNNWSDFYSLRDV